MPIVAKFTNFIVPTIPNNVFHLLITAEPFFMWMFATSGLVPIKSVWYFVGCLVLKQGRDSRGLFQILAPAGLWGLDALQQARVIMGPGG